MISFVHINFLLILLISPFPSFYYHVLLFCKHHLIFPKQYSDWLISIKVHQSLKKNRMEFYSIKVDQSFWSKISLTVVTIKVSSKTLSKFSLTKKTLIVTTGLYNMLERLLFIGDIHSWQFLLISVYRTWISDICF